MKKQLNKLVAVLLTGVMAVSILPLNSFAAVGTGEKAVASRRTGQVTFYQDGALSDAYLEGDWTEQYTAPEEGTFEGDLYKGLEKFEDCIFLANYPLPEDEAVDCYQRVINSNPDLFYVSGNLSYFLLDYCVDCNGFVYYDEENGNWLYVVDLTYDANTGNARIFFSTDPCNHRLAHNYYGALYAFLPQYITNNKNQISAMKSRFDTAVKDALAGIDENMSDLDKALYCHDYIVKSNNYDYQNFLADAVPTVSHSAYGALVNRVSVCDGYALAYSYLLQKLGIETRLVTSTAMAHAWSAVELDGEWYFVDCTGDDIIDSYSNAADSDRFDVVYHDTFLMSEALLSSTWYSDGPYRGWAQTDIVANSTKYDDAYWRLIAGDDEENPVIQWGVTNEYGYCDGYWYYVDDITYNIMKTNDPTKAGEVYSTLIKDAWITWGGWLDGYKKPACFGKASVHTPSKTMYVSDAERIYAIDLTQEEAEPEVYYEYTDEYYEYTDNSYIYGITVVDDYLYLGIANSPYEKETLSPRFIGEIQKGDVDGDGFISTDDAFQVLRLVTTGKKSFSFLVEAAKINSNDSNDKPATDDASQILKFTVSGNFN